jgi:hypothetical protein
MKSRHTDPVRAELGIACSAESSLGPPQFSLAEVARERPGS